MKQINLPDKKIIKTNLNVSVDREIFDKVDEIAVKHKRTRSIVAGSLLKYAFKKLDEDEGVDGDR